MKFGHEYEKVLASEGFPKHWIDISINYKGLKKDIKGVKRQLEHELNAVGLDASALDELLGSCEDKIPKNTVHGAGARRLELRLLIDDRTQLPVRAALSDQTRSALQILASETTTKTADPDQKLDTRLVVPRSEIGDSTNSSPIHQSTHWEGVPLESAVEFRHQLDVKSSELQSLQQIETRKLEAEVGLLGSALTDVIDPVKKSGAAGTANQADLDAWRALLRLYVDTPIFYSAQERTRGARNFAQAKAGMMAFDNHRLQMKLPFKTRAAKVALEQFLKLNLSILQTMYFQEINDRAMYKITKKFDKRTHLRLPATMRQENRFANAIARDVYAEISTKLVPLVPQLDQWECPVCYSVAWRPIRLGCCQAVFCIRCESARSLSALPESQ